MKTNFYKSNCCGVDSIDLRRCFLLFRLINREQRKWFCYVRIGNIFEYCYNDNKFTCIRQAKQLVLEKYKLKLLKSHEIKL